MKTKYMLALGLAGFVTAASVSAAGPASPMQFTSTDSTALVAVKVDSNADTFAGAFSFSASGAKQLFSNFDYAVYDRTGSNLLYAPDWDAVVRGNSLGIGYNDFTEAGFGFVTGQTYLLKVFADLKGSTGTGLFSTNHGTVLNVSMVPEPNTYAMLLAGLGMVGVILRRRTGAGS